MRNQMLLALAAGVASGLLNLGAGIGSPLGFALAHLTQLPLFLAGLGIGVPGVALAAAAGALVVGVPAGPLGAASYLAFNGLPAGWLSRQALLWRQGPAGREWYPAGLLLTWLVGLAAAYVLLLAAWFGLFADGLLPAIRATLETAIGVFGPALSEPQREALLAWARLVPGMGAAYLMLVVVVNGTLAQRLLRRGGRNLRPSEPLAALRLPPYLMFAFAASLVLMLLPGTAGFLGVSLAFIIGVAYVLLGLATLHALLRAWSGPGPAVVVFYLLLVFLLLVAFPLVLLLVAIGVLEQAVGIRRRITGRGKPDEEE